MKSVDSIAKNIFRSSLTFDVRDPFDSKTLTLYFSTLALDFLSVNWNIYWVFERLLYMIFIFQTR